MTHFLSRAKHHPKPAESAVKLAMVLGVCGAGKGYVADHLTQPKVVIRIDDVRRRVLESMDRTVLARFSKGLPPDWENRWDIWIRLSDDESVWADLIPHFIDAVVQECPTVSSAEAILLEGGLLALEPFRRRIFQVLEDVAQNMEGVLFVWLDPCDERVLENRKLRGRSSDLTATILTVRGEKDDYKEHALNSGADRHSDAATVTAAIDSFFKSH